jgi:dihydrofolate reductase
LPSDVLVDLFVSVDGWAGSDGLPPYFGYLGPELAEWIRAESAVPEVMLMGRVTFDVLSALPEDARDEGWERMQRQQKVIFSRTLTRVPWPNTRLSNDLVGEVRAMRGSDGPRLRTIGSLSVARQLVSAGLVDRLRLMIFPLLAGQAGRESAFAGVASVDLEPVDQLLLDGRVLLVEYRPTGRDIPRG